MAGRLGDGLMQEQGRYAPLGRYLSELGEHSRTFSFQDIEAIVGRSLPPSASGPHGRQWWANTSTHSQGQAWIGAGWKVEDVDVGARRVRFRRARGAQASGATPTSLTAEPRVGDAVNVPMSAFSGSARRMIEDYVEAYGGDAAGAVRRIVEAAAVERRKQLIEWFAERIPQLGDSSAELIREDRDAR
jgi:hypothetical protein